MQKRINLFILLSLHSILLLADNVSISISAPKEVGVGDQFRVSYEISSHQISHFESPDFDGFRILDNHQSSSSSTTIINGQVSTKSSTTFTFLLSAPRAGEFIIGSARIHINGETYSTKKIPIRVTAQPSGHASSSALPSTYSNNQTPSPPPLSHPTPSSPDTRNSNLFVRAIASKTKVYEQEAILLTYKIYASQELYVTGFQAKLPVLNGFHIQELEPDHSQSSETYNGKVYNTAVWKQYVIYPQSTGTCEIPSVPCVATISIPNGYMDPFGMFPRTETQEKEIKANALSIEVQPLPSPPSTFYGGVGDFNISSSINKRKFKAGEVLSLKVNITGTGNLKLIETPTIDFPTSFETYDCKVVDDFELTRSGHEGSKVFEYMAVPQQGGQYTIPSLQFTYFNSSLKSYQTLTTHPYTIDVTSNGAITPQTEVEELDKDIKHIKLGDVDLRQDNYSQLYSWKWIIAYILSVIIFIVLYILLHGMFPPSASNSIEKRKTANKLAMRQLEKSRMLMQSGKSQEFYVELLNALYTFPQNKLNISNEEFNKENVRQILEDHQVPIPVIDEYLSLVDECEFTHYTSGLSDHPMEDYYNKAMSLISQLDNSIK